MSLSESSVSVEPDGCVVVRVPRSGESRPEEKRERIGVTGFIAHLHSEQESYGDDYPQGRPTIGVPFFLASQYRERVENEPFSRESSSRNLPA